MNPPPTFLPDLIAWAAVVLIAVVCGGCGAGEPPAQFVDPMPGDGFLGVWMRDGDTRVYPGAELYGHINGGAEVFLELGFERLEVQRYTTGAAEVAVELYRMSDAPAALGVYLMKCGTETAEPSLTARHTAGPHQLQLVHGSSYLSVNVLRSDGDLQGTLVEFARHMVEQLPGADTTGVFAELPAAGRVDGSERVVRGPFTLESLYTLGEGDILALTTGATAVAAQYDGPDAERTTRIIARYPDEAAAESAFGGLVTNLDSYIEVLSSEPARLVFSDYAGRFGEVVRDGAVLDIRVHLSTRPD
jgi:hypothetical protein